MIYWKVENVKRRGRKWENKDFQGNFFRCFSARSEPESWFVVIRYQKARFLNRPESRGLNCLGRPGCDLNEKGLKLFSFLAQVMAFSPIWLNFYWRNNLEQLPFFGQKDALMSWGYTCIGLGWWNWNLSNHCNVCNSFKDWEMSCTIFRSYWSNVIRRTLRRIDGVQYQSIVKVIEQCIFV